VRGALASSEFDLLLLDIRMHGDSGFEVLDIVTADAPEMAIVLLTGVDDPYSAAAALETEAYGYLVKPFGPHEIEIAVRNALARRDLEQERKVHLHELGKKVSERTVALREVSQELARATQDSQLAERETWQRLQTAVHLRDDETGKHIERVGWIANLLAARIGLSEDVRQHLGMAAALHDVGKIGIPDLLLLKPGPLTSEEYAIVQQHAEIGYRMLAGSPSPVVSLGATIALTHHERWDGEGYPRGMAGTETPIESRITSVVDAFDAMTHKRVYRGASTVEEAVEELVAERGKQFDGDIVDVMVGAIDEVVVILDENPDEEESPIRVLLVGDRRQFDKVLMSFLVGKEDILAVGTADTMEEARRLTRGLKPEVVLLDEALPDGTEVEAIRLIKAEHPPAKILMLTDAGDPRTLSGAIQAGGAGYLLKGKDPGTIVDAIRVIHSGESIVPRDELPALLRGFTRTRRGLGSAISAREREVLQLLAEGLSTEEIAERLVLSMHTIRNHIQRVMGKLNAHSRLEAVTTAVREGVVVIDIPA
jgi:putative two-component system response regulator